MMIGLFRSNESHLSSEKLKEKEKKYIKAPFLHTLVPKNLDSRFVMLDRVSKKWKFTLKIGKNNYKMGLHTRRKTFWSAKTVDIFCKLLNSFNLKVKLKSSKYLLKYPLASLNARPSPWCPSWCPLWCPFDVPSDVPSDVPPDVPPDVPSYTPPDAPPWFPPWSKKNLINY